MEKIDLSTNSRSIQDAYDKVVRGDPSANYVVYSVDKNSSLEVTETGNGPLDEFVDHFTDGKVQFGLSRVTVPGSDVSKNLLLGWCPDNSPSKSRLSFASNFAEVSRVLNGYHVQVTARDQDDLDVDDFLHRIGAAAGARYSIQTPTGSSITKKPAPSKPFVSKSIPSKPSSFVPMSTGKPIATNVSKPVVPISAGSSKPSAQDDDGWGGEQEIEERDFQNKPLEDVPSAYKPTKVNIDELRKQKSDTISSQPKAFTPKKEEDDSITETQPSLSSRLKTFKDNETDNSADGRLTSLPKPKINNSVASRFNPATSSSSNAPSFGSKPSFGNNHSNEKNVVGGASRNFANQGGKTPAQIWAEKRGQYKSVSPESEDVSQSVTSSNGNELSERFNKLNLTKNVDEEEKVEEDENDAEEKDDVEEEDKDEKPAISSSTAAEFPKPPARSLPPAKEVSPEPESEPEIKEEIKSAPIPLLPARNLPPPPVRQVPAASVEEEKEEESEKEADEESAPPAPSLPSRSESKNTGKSAIAEYDYEKDENNEIGFAEGDLIVEIDFVDDDWWSGKHSKSGETGLFPSSYVALQNDESNGSAPSPPAPAPAPVAASEAKLEKSNGKTAVAEYDYEKDEDNEIDFAEGDLIVDIEFVDEDWWSGKHSKSGEEGLFPANYVKLNN